MLVYWLPQLSIGPADETNKLLRLLVMRVDNATLTDADLGPSAFVATSGNIRINLLLSISLTISLLASFGTLLAQQWIAHFKGGIHLGLEKDRWEKRRKLDGAQRWHLETIVELVLPTIMQAALVVFLIGLIDLLGSLSSSVALPNLILACLGACAFIVSIIFSIWDPYCPFQTSIPKILSYPFLIVTHIVHPSSIYNFVLHTPAPLQRRPETTEMLEAKAIRTTLESSYDDDALADNARNLTLLRDPAALRILTESPTVLPRLTYLSSATRGPEYSLAAAHLTFAGPALDNGHLQSIGRPRWASTSQYCIYRPGQTVALLPASFAVIGATSFNDCGVDLAMAKRYLDYVLATFRGSPVGDNVITVGMMAWYLSAYRHYSLRERELFGRPVPPTASEINLLHHPRKDWQEVKTAYGEFQRFSLDG